MSLSRVSLFAKLGVSLGIVGAVFYIVDWDLMLSLVLRARGDFLLLVCFFSPLSLLLLTLRWQSIARHCRLEVPYLSLLRFVLSAQFLNAFLPGAVAGDLYKATVLTRSRGAGVTESLSSVMIDRLVALLALLLLAITGLYTKPDFWHHLSSLPLNLSGSRLAWILATLLAILGGGLVAIRRGWPQLWGNLEEKVRMAFALLWGFFAQPAAAIKALTLATLVHYSNFLVFYFLSLALGFKVSLGDVMVLMPVIVLVSMLPISVNGHGIREVILILFFSLQPDASTHSATASALALSLLFVANDLVWSLPGAIFLFSKKHSPA